MSPTKQRLGFVLVVATAAGILVAVKRVDHPDWLSDLAQLTAAAQGWWHGRNPYEAVRASGQWPFPLLYPFPAVLAVLPLSFIRQSWLADALFVTLGTALLAWGLTRDRLVSPKLVALISAPFLYSIILSQWSPILVAAALIPGAGFLLACKPTIGLALFAAYPRRSSAIGCALLLAISVALNPTWPRDWLAAVHEAPNAIAPVTISFGWLVLLVALCWRRPAARLLLGLACIPHTTLAYEALPLFLIIDTWPEAWTLWIGTTVGLVGQMVAGPYASQYDWVRHGAIWLVWCAYLPCTAIVLEREFRLRSARNLQIPNNRRAIIRPDLTVPATHDPGRRTQRRRRAAARDLTLHASLLAVLLWAAVAADVLSPGPLGRYSGVQKGNDFAQFYTMASLAVSGRFDSLEDDGKFRSAQQPYLAPGARASYPALYGPQVAIVLAPLALIPYLAALALWIFITIAGIVWAVRQCWRACPPLHEWWRPVLAVTAAFSPFAYLVLAGQLSALAVVSLALTVSALARGSKLAAGLALGILGYKLSLFVPALAVCLLAGEGTMALAAAALAVAQLLALVPIVGIGVVQSFISNTLSAARAPDALAVTPPLMFSLRTFWSQLLSGEATTMAYGISALTVWGLTAHKWRRTPDPLGRVALLAISMVLTAPHLFLYDLVVLIPAFIASAGIVVVRRLRVLRWATTAAFLIPLVAPPIAYLTGLQVGPVVLAGWLAIFLSTDLRAEARAPD